MSATNDFLLKFTSAITYKANQYCAFLNQGVDDCCLKRQVQILTKQFDIVVDYYNGRTCLTSTDILKIVKFCNTLVNSGLGYPDLTTIPVVSIITPITPITTPSLLPAGRLTLLADTTTTVSYNHPMTTLNYVVIGNAYATDGSGLQPHIIDSSSLTLSGFQVYTLVETVFNWEVSLIA